MINNPYQILGVKSNSSFKEIKYAYRELVKQHHPDAGGDEETILAINAAWEILGDQERREAYDLARKVDNSLDKQTKIRDKRNTEANSYARSIKNKFMEEENELSQWLKIIYKPIDIELGKIINSFPSKLRDLSADPYDDILMEDFCLYLDQSKNKINNINKKYQSIITPYSAKEISLSLYHCFSKVEDALNEFDLYTKGYVDDYLHDGSAMLQEAKRRRKDLKEERRSLPI